MQENILEGQHGDEETGKSSQSHNSIKNKAQAERNNITAYASTQIISKNVHTHEAYAETITSGFGNMHIDQNQK